MEQVTHFSIVADTEFNAAINSWNDWSIIEGTEVEPDSLQIKLGTNRMGSGRIRTESTHESPNKEEGFVRCPQCGRPYRWVTTLKRHLKYECGKEAQLRCPFCTLKFKHKSSLTRHIQNIHREKLQELDS